MTMPEPRVERVTWAAGGDALAWLREQVFVVEQGVPAALEWDGLDPDCIHLLVRDGQGRPAGCARITPDGQIGRMAVLPELRGRGIGRALLMAAVRIAREARMPRVYLHAQTHARAFYGRHGFVAMGPVFMEAGIAHVTMELALGTDMDASDP
jgi:predicted GNAT family N-acyltransferase